MSQGKSQPKTAAGSGAHTNGPPEADPPLSRRARAMQLATQRDAKIAMLHQAPSWWGAHLYHCPVCDRDFAQDVEAAEHLVEHQHPVLRWDSNACWD